MVGLHGRTNRSEGFVGLAGQKPIPCGTTGRTVQIGPLRIIGTKSTLAPITFFDDIVVTPHLGLLSRTSAATALRSPYDDE